MAEHEFDEAALDAAMDAFMAGPVKVLAAQFAAALAPLGLDVTELVEALEATGGAGITAGATASYIGAATPAVLEAFVALYTSGLEHGMKYIDHAEGR
jgi:uncharacterized membrane protein